MPWNDDAAAHLLSRDALLLVEERGSLGLWAWDLENDRFIWSAGMYRVLGLRPFAQEPSLELYNSIIHPDDRLDMSDPARVALSTLDHRHRIVRPDGEVRWIRSCGRIVHTRDAVPVRMIGAVFDITEQRRGLEAYQREAGLLSAVRELTGGVIWMTAADGSIADPAEWRAAVGHNGGQHLGRSRLEDVHPDDRHIVREAWEEALRNRVRYTAEYRAKWDGSYARLSSRATSIRDARGDIVAWIGFSIALPTAPGETGIDCAPNAAQVRAARGMLGWTAKQLAEKSGLSFSTIRRVEAGDGKLSATTVETIWKTFEHFGVRFTLGAGGRYTVTGGGR